MSEYLNNIVYGVKSFLTGMKLTMDHFRNKKKLVATLQYPHEKWPIPDRNIGFNHSEYNLIRSRLHVDIDDCIACMQCERACPVDCIKIDSIKPPKGSDIDCGMTSNDTQKKMIVSRFTIDMSECMYCNLCVYPCPEECIYMVGGPNDEKHEIDYEFSQYKRDGMIFEFADATDEAIRSAGGEQWLDQRDTTLAKHNAGAELKGEVKSVTPKTQADPVKTDTLISTAKPATQATQSSGELEIKSFNTISDKMCRGIAKKVFMAGKRGDKDAVAILTDVAQALSDVGKMSDDIQLILDGLTAPPLEGASSVVKAGGDIKMESVPDTPEAVEMKEFDIKDLNVIDDKMARGTAKKAFMAAKRSGEDKVEAVRKALTDSGKLDTATEALLTSFSGDAAEVSAPAEAAKPSESAEEVVVVPKGDLPLFEIADLNGIDDKMTRGMAKKIFMAAKRAGKTRAEVIADLRLGLTEAGKLDDATDAILNKLESEN